MVAEVYEESETESSRLQVIVDLLSMLVVQRGDGLDLHDDFVETDEIRLVGLFQGMSLVGNLQLGLRYEGDCLETQFQLQAFLIHRFHEAATLILIHFKTSSKDRITFFFIQQ